MGVQTAGNDVAKAITQCGRKEARTRQQHSNGPRQVLLWRFMLSSMLCSAAICIVPSMPPTFTSPAEAIPIRVYSQSRLTLYLDLIQTTSTRSLPIRMDSHYQLSRQSTVRRSSESLIRSVIRHPPWCREKMTRGNFPASTYSQG